MTRKWLPHLAELIDRLSIHQLKEVLIPESKNKYSEEMKLIVHDIDVLLKEHNSEVTGGVIHAVIALAQINCHIWYNEASARRGEHQDLTKLKLTHGLNGIRNRLMNKILSIVNEESRKDYKTDCLAAEFKDWDMSILHD